MAKCGLSVAALALVVAACGGGAATPQETFEALRKCAEDKDYGGIYDLMSPAGKKGIEEEFAGAKKRWEGTPPELRADLVKVSIDPTSCADAREFFCRGLERESGRVAELATAVVTETKVEGDRARVLFKSGDRADDMKMEKVNGKWLLSFE